MKNKNIHIYVCRNIYICSYVGLYVCTHVQHVFFDALKLVKIPIIHIVHSNTPNAINAGRSEWLPRHTNVAMV